MDDISRPIQWLLLFGVGLVAGAINTIAGGGSLLTLPALIFLGLPAPVANGTNRVGVFIQSLTATLQFRREQALEVRGTVLPLVATVVGAAGGALLSVDLDETRLEQAIGVAMLVMLALLLFRPSQWLEPSTKPPAPRGVQAAAFFLVGVYGGFLQAGVGFFLLAGLVWLARLELVPANGVKSLLILVFTLPAAVVFVLHDLIAWEAGISLAAGSALGGWLGARVSVGWGAAIRPRRPGRLGPLLLDETSRDLVAAEPGDRTAPQTTCLGGTDRRFGPHDT